MSNNIFPDWEKVVRDNKKLYIDSIIDRYGEENRELLSRRYDETKLIFFETPKRLRKYLEVQTKEELIIETLKFLKEIGIDTSTIYEENDFLLSSDPIINKKLELLFGKYGRFSTKSIPDTILEFSSKEKKKAEMHTFCMSFLKEYSINDYQLYNQSPEEILKKYKAISNLALAHLQKVFGKYYYVMEYLKELKIKESKMKSKSIDDKVNLYIVNGSINKKIPLNEKEEMLSVIKTRKANFSHCDILSNTNILFLSPYCSNFRTFDRILDHEYTHSLESSVYLSSNGTLILKCGMRMVIYDEFNNPVEEKYRKINEAITHLISIQSTLKRYSNKQYIFEDPKEDISKIGVSSSCYDKNLPKAIALVMALPKDFIKRRIETTIDFIYDYFDENTWDELEEMIDDDNVDLEAFTNYINSKRGIKL